jgi:3',5'-cyclic AMP phosphodiesterase CpdA
MFKGRSRPFVCGVKIPLVCNVFASLFAAMGLVSSLAGAGLAADQYFLVKPYLQLGFEGKRDSSGLDIVWFSEEAKHKWQVDYTTSKTKTGKGSSAESITERMISLPGFSAPYYKLTAHLNKLPLGETFNYKVLRDSKEVFAASAKGKKGPGQPSRIAIFGDCGIGGSGANGEGQRKLAKNVGAANPDLVIIPGDIAYQQGLFSQYLTNFFPIYNLDPAKVSDGAVGSDKKVATTASADDGIASMRSTLWAGVLGNHDISLSGYTGTNINKYPDALAYFIFWNEPLNGHRVGSSSGNKNFPFMAGELNRQELFKKSAGDSYPVMNNYSFDYGDTHFTALDGNYYMDWNDPKLRAWLTEDLRGAQDKAWRIVVMHQPGFLIGAAHSDEQKMRLITDIAQKYNVNMIIAGHSHCYERSVPFLFTQEAGDKLFNVNPVMPVNGTFTLDKHFDGVKNTKPNGIIYVISGAGGARLYPIDTQAVTAPDSYMTKYDSSTHSFSSLDIDDKTITFKQITEDGKVIDQFVVSK